MTKEQIEIFEKTFAQLCGLYDDITILVKKNPNDVMNIFKLRNINKVISSANGIVGDTKPFEDFDGFDVEGDMPTNSDVTMLLGQPTEFSSTEYHDNITYRYGNYDINSLSIDFKKGKVSSVRQY